MTVLSDICLFCPLNLSDLKIGNKVGRRAVGTLGRVSYCSDYWSRLACTDRANLSTIVYFEWSPPVQNDARATFGKSPIYVSVFDETQSSLETLDLEGYKIHIEI